MRLSERIDEIQEKMERAAVEGNTSAHLFYSGMLKGLLEAATMIADDLAPKKVKEEEVKIPEEYILTQEKPKPMNLTLADICIILRKLYGLDQRTFGKKFGVSQFAIHTIECGTVKKPRIEKELRRAYEEEFNVTT